MQRLMTRPVMTLLGGIAAYFAKRELEVRGLLPKRTVDILKDDKVWIQSEVKQI